MAFPSDGRRGVLGMALIVGALVYGNGTARADLRFAHLTIEAGAVKAGAPLACRFDFLNEGPEVVEILDARPSCGCMTPRLSAQTIKPREQGFLFLEVNTLSESAGVHRWTVTLRYRRGDAVEEKTLHLTGDVTTEIVVQPPAMTIFTEYGLRHTISLTDLRPKALGITAVRASSAHLAVRLADERRDEVGHMLRTIQVEVPADCPTGRYTEAVSVFTDDPSYREIKVPITIVKQTRGRLSVSPNVVSVVGRAGQPVPSRIILVRDRDNEPIAIDKVTADNSALHCSWASGPGNMATIRIVVDEQRVDRKDFNCAVHISVTKPVAEIISVPVTCVLQ